MSVDRLPVGPRQDAAVEVSRAGVADAPGWDAYVTGHIGASGYHEWAWRGVIERTFGHAGHYLVARRNGRVAGVLPLVEMRSLLFGRLLTSLPFLNYGGVLADDAGAARALIAEAGRLAREQGVSHVELRHLERQFADLPARSHKVAMKLAVAPGMWDRFDRKVRNQVRKAEKSGLTVVGGGAELVAEFYRVFSRNMRDLGTPVYPRALFENVLGAFPDRTSLIVVRLGAKPVAAGLTFRTRGTVEVPWASSIRAYNGLCPNHLLYWRAIEAAVADGCDTFDFGRSTPHEGTYKFKEQWGAVPVPLHWEYVMTGGGAPPDHGPTNPKFRAAIALWQRLPLPVANFLGPRIVRGIP